MDLGELIRERRAMLGITQTRLAEMVGKSASTVRSWERNAAVPARDALQALSRALDLPAEQMIELSKVVADDTSEGDATSSHDQVQPDALFDDAELEDADDVELAASGGDQGDENDVGDSVPGERGTEIQPSIAKPDRTSAERTLGGQLVEDAAEANSKDLVEDVPRTSPSEEFVDDAIEESGDELVEDVDIGTESSPEGADSDSTTVMGEGVAMAVAVTPAAPPAPAIQSPSSFELPIWEHAEDDTGEVAPVEVVEPTAPAPRVLGTALSTDPVAPPPAASLDPTELVVGRVADTALTASPYPSAPTGVDVLPAEQGFMEDPDQQRTYQIRSLLTAASLLGLLILFRWAFGGFAEGFATLRDSFFSHFNF